MLQDFVTYFELLYPRKYLSYIVHNLLHITQCVSEHGGLHELSAYKFENFLQKIKRKIKSPTNILQQVRHNFHDYLSFKKQDNLGFKIINKNIQKYVTKEYTLTKKSPNNICCLKNDYPLVITNFSTSEGKFFITGNRFLRKTTFYEAPETSADFGIYLVNNSSLSQEETFSIEDVAYKYVSFPINDDLLLIPIIYTSDIL